MTHDDRGVSESTQWAVLLPALLLCVLGVLQAALWVHGQGTARQAAAAAAEAQAVLDAPAGAGQQAAEAVAAAGGLTDVQVVLGGDGALVDVTVTARVPLFFDLGQGRVHGHADLPRERVSQP